MAESSPDTLRVAVLASAPEREEWEAALVARGAEVHTAHTLDELLRSRPDLAVVITGASEAAELATTLGRAGNTPPLALLVRGEDTGIHPLSRLVRSLFRAKRDWEATFDAVLDPVAVLSAEGTVQRANLALARALGEPITAVVWRGYQDLLGSAEGADPVAQSLADGRPRTAEAAYTRLPSLRQVTTAPFDAGDNTPPGLVVILKDVSQIKEQQQRLLQAARLADIGQLAAGVAHEINTPLASIALRAESLLRSAADPALRELEPFKNFPRYLQTIDEEIFRCKKIIGALLDFARSRRTEVRDTDLNTLCETAADLVGHQMRLKQVALELKLEPRLPFIKADDGQLRQALIALLINALDATSAGGHVVVSTARTDGDSVRLAVEDDGAGIAPEHLDRIWSPFFSTKPVGQGTGLGLAICHGIVAAHGGHVEVDSEPGQGARFSLVLPVYGPSAPAAT